MDVWFNGLSDNVKAAIIGAAIGAVVALVSILLKDWIFQLFSENRKKKKERSEAFKKYATPIIISSVSLAFRIKEIFEDRGHFLLDSTPKDSFNAYKYISTLYRLTSLLGWIRASKKEISFVEVKRKKFKSIESALNRFENSLADGTHIEVSRVEYLCKELDLNYNCLDESAKKRLGIEIEHIFRKYIFDNQVQLPNKLSDEKQIELLKQISDCICSKTKNAEIETDIIKEKQKTAIKEISRIENWIYRDWQFAIGDMMISKIENAHRKYDIIGYNEFECLYDAKPEPQKKWIERTDGLFKNLNVFVDDRFDARVVQLKNIYSSILNIIETYVEIQGYTCVSEETLNILRAYKKQLLN